jgi:hypothetical protein
VTAGTSDTPDTPDTPDGFGVVTYAVKQFLDPDRPFGLTVAVTWSCTECDTLVRCKGVADAVQTLQAHALAHHHRGAGRVIS